VYLYILKIVAGPRLVEIGYSDILLDNHYTLQAP